MGVVGVGFDFARVGCSGRQSHRCTINELLYVKSLGWQLGLVKPRRFPLPPPAVLVNDTGVRVPNALGGRS
jgi:hypothetical protein